MNTRSVVILSLLLVSGAISALAVPPKVVKAVPENNSSNVDPGLTEMRIVFDQPMSPGGRSVVGGGPKYPKFVGQPRWEDDKTYVMSWKLEPDHEYWLSINNNTYKNFRGENGESAEPYPISFKTAASAGAPATPSTDAASAEAAQPPKVVVTTPEDGASKVDPNLSELRVVFDQPMSSGGWSVVGGGPKFPKLVGKGRWVDERTFTWNIKLEPEHQYALSINSSSYGNFRGTNGVSAVPHPIMFTTGPRAGGAAAETSAASSSREAYEHLRRAIDEDYSYRDLRKVDWEKRFKEYGPRLEACDTNWKFARMAGEMLSPAQDIHMWLRCGEEQVFTWRRTSAWNVAFSKLSSYVPDWQKRSPIVASGRFEDGIRYLSIRSWPANAEAELDPAFDVLNEAMIAGKPLIIDVRANGGGAEPLAAKLAGCFVSAPVVYARHVVRSGGKLSEPMDRILSPNKDRVKYRGKVLVLMGPGTVSSSESFVMMMKQVRNCTLVGQRTAGCSGNPRPVDLGNGVTAFIPSWQDLKLDGTCIEGTGIEPDVEVKTGAKSFDEADPVIGAALKILRE